MQALAISSPASPATPRAASSPTNTLDKATDAQEDPVFAHVVRDVLNRSTSSSGNSASAQSVRPSRVVAAAIATTPQRTPKLGKDLAKDANSRRAVTASTPVSLPDLSGSSSPILPAALPNAVQTLPDDLLANAGVEPPLTPENGAGDSGSTGSPIDGIAASKPKDGEAPVQVVDLNLPEQLAAQSSVATLPPILSRSSTAPATVSVPADKTGANDGANTSLQTPTISTPSAPTTSAPTTAVSTAGVPTTAAPTTTRPNTDAPTIAEPTTAASTIAAAPTAADPRSPLSNATSLPIADGVAAQTAMAGGQPIASLSPQIAKLQGKASTSWVQASSTAVAGANVPSAQTVQNAQVPQAGVSARSLPPVASVRIPTIPLLPLAPKEVQPLIDGARAPVQAPSSAAAPTDNTGCQDTTSDRKNSGHSNSPSALDASPSTSAVHETTSFLQALEVAASVKQDASPAPNVPLPTPAANAPAAPSDHIANSSETALPSPSSTLSSSQAPDRTPANRVVDSAKLVEAAGRSEMRIAMDTDKLGPVELRARMNGDEVGAAITVEKRDAHAVLAVEMPALQQALSDKHLQVEHITLLHASLGSTAGDAGSAPRQDSRSSPHPAAMPWSMGSGGIAQMFANPEQSGIFDAKGRLSVRA